MTIYPIRFSRNLLLTSLILLAVVLLTATIAQADSLLFMDDFKDGTADNWEVIDYGDFEIVDEAFCFQTI